MAKYVVRKGFVVHLKLNDNGETRPYLQGEEIELDENQYVLYAHQIDPTPVQSTKTKT